MAHITDLRAGIFTYLDINNETPLAATDTAAEYAALFVGGTPGTADSHHLRLPSVREFPSIGTPANIVNVPVYGQATSSQVQGQADAPTLEVTVNYVADDMTAFHALIGTQVSFRFAMCSAAITKNEGAAAALTPANTQFFWKGKIEAILVNPSLTDATTATITISTQSDFVGPHTM